MENENENEKPESEESESKDNTLSEGGILVFRMLLEMKNMQKEIDFQKTLMGVVSCIALRCANLHPRVKQVGITKKSLENKDSNSCLAFVIFNDDKKVCWTVEKFIINRAKEIPVFDIELVDLMDKDITFEDMLKGILDNMYKESFGVDKDIAWFNNLAGQDYSMEDKEALIRIRCRNMDTDELLNICMRLKAVNHPLERSVFEILKNK